ncbi:hypothetical protein LuPra_03766 [Luteitalea pratensis]|uniref:DUF4062 domain-containing protein n=1 Tax=Luteitalea pratensis TaxID=1855912 RepID=A0A143PQY7_LUTPR|nr:DUF4062 domain-containing protein [Luteitalea pratensis]AMY10530.1 hypothetical protein LuPra_03766 [Luteitalea pratensis]
MKVFLSSTAQDLVAYRQVADDTILRLSQQAVVMERFGPLAVSLLKMGLTLLWIVYVVGVWRRTVPKARGIYW